METKPKKLKEMNVSEVGEGIVKSFTHNKSGKPRTLSAMSRDATRGIMIGEMIKEKKYKQLFKVVAREVIRRI